MNKLSIEIYLITTDEVLLRDDFYDKLTFYCKNKIIDAFQLRAKHIPIEEMIEIGKRCKTICKKYDVLFIVNDSLQLAIILKADGIHVGINDTPINKIKKHFSGIIGFSITSINEYKMIKNHDIDYIGVGALFKTDSKKDAKYFPIKDLPILHSLVNGRYEIIGIGGINFNNFPLIEKYVDGIAVIKLLFD